MKLSHYALFAAALVASAPVASAQFTSVTGLRGRVIPRPAILPGDYNVLMIVLDDVGTDKLAMYSENPILPLTPRLDELRANGLLFTRMYANPVCSPTRAALLTGRYGFRTGMGNALKRHDQGYYLSDDELFVPELIRDALAGGATTYAMGAFGKWHLSTVDDDCHAVRNGFDVFQGSMMNNGNHFRWNHIAAEAGNPPECSDTVDTRYDVTGHREDASAWIAQQNGPFFVYFAPNAPHKPQQIPPFDLLSADTQARLEELGYEEGDGPKHPNRYHWRLLHDVTIEAIDTEIGNLLDGMSPEQRERTVTVVLGDNGTDVGVIRPPQNSLHGKGTLYNLGTRVPLLVSGRIVGQNAGGTCDRLVAAVDLWKTLANIAGVNDWRIRDVAATIESDSLSFLQLLRTPKVASLRTTTYCEWFIPNGPLGQGEERDLNCRALGNGAYKYLRTAFAEMDPEEQLYNIGAPRNDWEEALDLGPDPSEPDDQDAIDFLRDAMIDLSGS